MNPSKLNNFSKMKRIEFWEIMRQIEGFILSPEEFKQHYFKNKGIHIDGYLYKDYFLEYGYSSALNANIINVYKNSRICYDFESLNIAVGLLCNKSIIYIDVIFLSKYTNEIIDIFRNSLNNKCILDVYLSGYIKVELNEPSKSILISNKIKLKERENQNEIIFNIFE